MEQEYNHARIRLEALQAAEEALDKEIGSKCDWDDPLDVALYKSEIRGATRDKILGLLVPERICPVCGEFKVSRRSWVINKRKTLAICRECFQRKLPDPAVEELKIDKCIFGEKEIRYEIDGFALASIREEMDISLAAFARFMGWSTPYQFKLENGEVRSVDLVTAESILEVIRKRNIITADCL